MSRARAICTGAITLFTLIGCSSSSGGGSPPSNPNAAGESPDAGGDATTGTPPTTGGESGADGGSAGFDGSSGGSDDGSATAPGEPDAPATTDAPTTTADGASSADTGATSGDTGSSSGGGSDGGTSSACVAAPSGWRDMASPTPILAADFEDLVWDGSEVLALGTTHTCAPGYTPPCGMKTSVFTHVAAAFQPSTNAWRVIAAPPSGNWSPATLWTGSRWLLFDFELGAPGASYDPTTNSWSSTAAIPLSDLFADPVWSTTTNEAVLVGSGTSMVVDAVAYSPSTDTWRTFPPSPLSPRSEPQAIWTGKRVLVMWGDVPGNPPTFPLDAAALDPATGAWQSLPDSGYEGRTASLGFSLDVGGGFWGGLHLTGITPDMSMFLDDGVMWNEATGVWVGMPAPPKNMIEQVWDDPVDFVQWTAMGKLWLWRSQSTTGPHGASWDPSIGVWTPMPDGGPGTNYGMHAVWTGCDAVVFGGGNALMPDGSTSLGMMFRP